MLPGSGFCSVRNRWVGTASAVISEPRQRLVKGTERGSPPWGQKPTERLGRRGEITGSEQTEAKVKVSPLQAGTPHFLRGVVVPWLEDNAHS